MAEDAPPRRATVQPSAVLVHYCLASGTLDDWMWRTVERKLHVTGSALDGAAASAFANDDGGGGMASRTDDGSRVPSSTYAGRSGSHPARPKSGDIRSFIRPLASPPLGAAPSASSAAPAAPSAGSAAPAARASEALAASRRPQDGCSATMTIDLDADVHAWGEPTSAEARLEVDRQILRANKRLCTAPGNPLRRD